MYFCGDDKSIENFVNDIFSDIGLNNLRINEFKFLNKYMNLYHHFLNIDLKEIASSYFVKNIDNYKPYPINNKFIYPEKLNFTDKNLFIFENANKVEEQEIIDLNNYIIEESESEESSFFDDDYEYPNDTEKKIDKNIVEINEVLTWEYDQSDEFYVNFNEKVSCLLFYKIILCDNNKIEKILKNPNYILNIKFEELVNDPNERLNLYYKKSSQFNFKLIIKLCYIASLVYNNKPDFLIHLLCYDINPAFIKYTQNKIQILFGTNFQSSDYVDDNFHVLAVIKKGSIVFRHNLCLMIFQRITMWLIKLNK